MNTKQNDDAEPGPPLGLWFSEGLGPTARQSATRWNA